MADQENSETLFPVIIDGQSSGNLDPQDPDPLRSRRLKSVSIEDLAQDVGRMSDVLSKSGAFEKKSGGFRLEEIKINLGISASGEIGFVIAKGEVEASASIELLFKAEVDEPTG